MAISVKAPCDAFLEQGTWYTRQRQQKSCPRLIAWLVRPTGQHSCRAPPKARLKSRAGLFHYTSAEVCSAEGVSHGVPLTKFQEERNEPCLLDSSWSGLSNMNMTCRGGHGSPIRVG